MKTAREYRALRLNFYIAVAAIVFLSCGYPDSAQHNKTKADNSSKASVSNGGSDTSTFSSDPVIRAMRQELERSKSQVKMENVAAPYYIEYRLSDVTEYSAEATFGALRQNQLAHGRGVRVVVRVGDYKQDSYYGPGVGVVEFAPLDNDDIALRRQLWMATDRAYKMASEALAGKKALLSQYSAEQPFDDFAKAPALQSIEPLAKLDYSAEVWEKALAKSTDLYRSNPKIQSLSARATFRSVNEYFVNTEGTITRQGNTWYLVQLSGETQAEDGMQLGRSPYYMAAKASELPDPAKLESDMAKMLETLKKLREAPLVEEDYRGPVLFSNDAADDVFYGMIGNNVLGIRPKPGDSARTIGKFSSNYKGRVLPAFLSVVDDPTMKSFQGHSLIGNYEVDEEGVRAQTVAVVTDGMLTDYLLGRMPIRDFPDSNGHGRAAPGQAPGPSIGVLMVKPKDALSTEDIKKKLIELCKEQNKEFGYYVETLSGFEPRLLYRVYVNDGHEQLVRGAVFNELDTRTLRNDLVAAGNDPLVSNREGPVPSTVIAPSILFDELEVKRTDKKNAKLPEYPPPALTPGR
jgi:predicted Zn-dependent protease